MEDSISDILGGGVERVSYLPDRSGIDLCYFDFPLCHDAFASGQTDARPLFENGCFWRVRGRKVLSYTLIAFDDSAEAWRQIQEKISSGLKVQTLNYTYERPSDIPTRQGPTEYWVESFTRMLRKDGKPATKLSPVWLKDLEIRPPSEKDVADVFRGWTGWAGNRHFMVFKGHYLKWLEMHFSEAGASKLMGFYKAGKPVGLFGYEEYKGTKAVVVAKHLPDIKPDVLWVYGLRDAGDGLVLCGSTADTLKSRFGMNSRESWTFRKEGLSEL